MLQMTGAEQEVVPSGVEMTFELVSLIGAANQMGVCVCTDGGGSSRI